MRNDYSSFRLTNCSCCKQEFSENSYKIFETTPENEVIFVKCSGCKRTFKLSFTKNQSETVCFLALTDLSFKDAKNFKDNAAISVDDVIQVHKALKFDNFTRIG